MAHIESTRWRFDLAKKGDSVKVKDPLGMEKVEGDTSVIAHSGDKLDIAAGRDAPRFHHECTASTFMTPTHVAYMVHACSAAVARATAKAARKYAHARAISHSVRENTLARPAVVQPTF